jgi:hypothetical protein
LTLAVDWVAVSSIVTAGATLVEARRAIETSQRVAVDILYGDHELGQRSITRFMLTRRDDGNWISSVSRHWNVDRPDPR